MNYPTDVTFRTDPFTRERRIWTSCGYHCMVAGTTVLQMQTPSCYCCCSFAIVAGNVTLGVRSEAVCMVTTWSSSTQHGQMGMVYAKEPTNSRSLGARGHIIRTHILVDPRILQCHWVRSDSAKILPFTSTHSREVFIIRGTQFGLGCICTFALALRFICVEDAVSGW